VVADYVRCRVNMKCKVQSMMKSLVLQTYIHAAPSKGEAEVPEHLGVASKRTIEQMFRRTQEGTRQENDVLKKRILVLTVRVGRDQLENGRGHNSEGSCLHICRSLTNLCVAARE
jgi:hypothetical protein